MAKKTLAELEEEYKRAEAKANELREKLKKETAAEEARKRTELLELVLRWAKGHSNIMNLDGAIAFFQQQIEIDAMKAEEKKAPKASPVPPSAEGERTSE